MGRFEYLVEKQPSERRLARRRTRGAEIPLEVIVSEWRPAPLSRLGHELWGDIDRYLEFFAIARAGEPEVSVRGRAQRVRARDPFHA